MRSGVRWLLLGVLAGSVLLPSAEASAAHLTWGGRAQDTAVTMTSVDPDIAGNPRASEGSGGPKDGDHRGGETAAGWVENELVQASHELDDLTVTTLGQAGRLAGRLIRRTRAGATEVHHAYLSVTTTLTSLGRCFEEGVAISPFGPAGPRAPDHPSGAAEVDDPCDLAGQPDIGPGVAHHATAQEESDPDGNESESDSGAAIGGEPQ
jgi:hypothetical protein